MFIDCLEVPILYIFWHFLHKLQKYESVLMDSRRYVITRVACTLDVNSELSSRWIFLDF